MSDSAARMTGLSESHCGDQEAMPEMSGQGEPQINHRPMNQGLPRTIHFLDPIAHLVTSDMATKGISGSFADPTDTMDETTAGLTTQEVDFSTSDTQQIGDLHGTPDSLEFPG